MNEKARLERRNPVLRKANYVSKAQKPVISQSANSPIDRILYLHKTIGNQAVQRLLKTYDQSQGISGKNLINLNIPHGLYSAVCTPTPSDVKGVQDFALKEVGATPSPGSFGAGFTSPKVSYSPTDLEIITTKTGKGVTCKPKAVTPTLSTEARYVSKGVHKIPDLDAEAPAEICGRKGKPITLPVYVDVFKEISGLAKQAEEEYCDDFGYAFDLTVGKWAVEVNKLAKAGKTYGPKDTEDECKNLVKKELSKSLDERLKDFAALAPKTDDRDRKGYHSFVLDSDKATVDDKCAKIIFNVIKSSTLNIGKIPPKDIMK